MSSWRVAEAIKTLQAEVNQVHPDRPRSADGTIGDARHAATKSDHNPTDPHPGVVTAWDITTADFTIDLAEKLRLMGKAGDSRVKYVIYRGQIASSKAGWAWRPYSGFSKHFDHIHLSVADDPAHYDSTAPWNVFSSHTPAAPKVRPITPAAKTYPTLHTGSTGDPVKRLQYLLHIKADGEFGPQTTKAVTAYQKTHHLLVDGIAGPATLRALGF